MKPNFNNPARDYALSFARGFSQGPTNRRATGDILSLAPGFRPVPFHGRTGHAPLSLAPGFSRVESGGGNEKTVSTVFLKRETVPEYQWNLMPLHSYTRCWLHMVWATLD